MNGELNGIMEEPMDTSSPPTSPKEKQAPVYPNHCKSANIHNNYNTNHMDQKPDLLNNCIKEISNALNNCKPNTSQTNQNNGKNHQIEDDDKYSNTRYNHNSNSNELRPNHNNTPLLGYTLHDNLILKDEDIINEGEVEINDQMSSQEPDLNMKDSEVSMDSQFDVNCALSRDSDSQNNDDERPEISEDKDCHKLLQDDTTNHEEATEIQQDEELKNEVSEDSKEEIYHDCNDEVNDGQTHDDKDIGDKELSNSESRDTTSDIHMISKDDEEPQDSISYKDDELSQDSETIIENTISEDVEVIKDDDDVECEAVTTYANNEISDEEVDSEEDSTDDEQIIDDTVSIDSNDDDDDDDDCKKNDDVVILDNGDNVVHEIISDNDENDDDCIIQPESKAISTQTIDLRRSSRAIKRRRYHDEDDEDESDIEEVTMEDPLHQYNKNKTIIVNDTKTLVEMAAKQMKSNQNDRKEPTVVIIDTNSILSGKVPLQAKNSVMTSVSSQHNAHDLYQSIAARGTTVTPVPTKNLINTATQSAPQPHILPSLTDDMFVVEAPSFIVPYVYEKPSIKPFREFVDVLGKELDELRSKEEQEKPDKEKDLTKDDDNDTRSNEDEEMEVDGEKDSKSSKSSLDDAEEVEVPKKKREKRDRKNDDDDASWDGESSEDSDDEVISDDDEKTVVIKEKDDSIDDIKEAISELNSEKSSGYKSDNYFDCTLGKFFINIGLNLVQEYVQNDLLKQQNRKLYREKKSGSSTRATESAISSLMKNLQFSKENNAPYSFPQHKCDFCSFKSESMLAMSHHLETPHMKNNVYKCNFCSFEIRSPHDILYHMEAEHNIRGRLERAPAYHQCANCPFEDNGKGKLARHLIPCAKKFKPELNLAPPIEWEPPAKIPKITRARNNMLSSYQATFTRTPMGMNNLIRTPLPNTNVLPAGINNYRPRNRATLPVTTRITPSHGTPMMRGGIMVRHNAPTTLANNYPIMNNQTSKNASTSTPKLLQHQPSISITPLPRPPQPLPGQTIQQSKGTFVICEICDGYIKDLEQLRNHMQWIHKVKIHPKMIYNRPPLNCQKCQFRFFTDQGLERHLLGSHGLVTSSMQEAANKGKDAGRCPVCGRVYQWKLLNHVARDHSVTLKPAHLSYKCTVCTATFGMYKQFENHVYSAHSVVAKRVIDKTKTASSKPNDSLLKPLKINDEITIIPQPAKAPTPNPKDQ